MKEAIQRIIERIGVIVAIVGIFVILCGIIFSATPAYGQQNTLILIVDVSASIDDDEMQLQMDGYLTSLQAFPYFDREYIEVILFSDNAVVVSSGSYYDALEYFENFSSPSSVYNTRVYSANKTTCVHRPFEFILENWDNYPGFVTIDIAADGRQNCGLDEEVRDLTNELTELGAAINALVVRTPHTPDVEVFGRVEVFYEDFVVNGFVVTADGFEDFARALQRKIGLEMSYLLE